MVTFGIMDLNQYLEKMNTTTRVIIIQIDEIIGAEDDNWTRVQYKTRIQGSRMMKVASYYSY